MILLIEILTIKKTSGKDVLRRKNSFEIGSARHKYFKCSQREKGR